MTVRIITLVLSLLVPANQSWGDDSLFCHQKLPAGISVEYGFGSFSMRDEYISKEKYTGTLPHMGVSWSRSHEAYTYFLSLDYRNSSDISNYNVSTDVYQFTLHQSFLYPLTKWSLLSRDVFAFLGPSIGAHFFYNEPQIAVDGFDYAQSFAVLISLGLHTEIFMPLGHGLQAEGRLRFAALSLGVRMVDDEEEDGSPVKPLTVFSGTNALFRLGLRYHLVSGLSLKAAYDMQMTRISSWEPLLAVSDNLIMTATYSF